MTMTMTTGDWLSVIFVVALASLVPVVWAIVDVARRPPWQFSPGRKVLWALTLGVGWLILWPVSLVSSVVYLTVIRRRLPPAAAGRSTAPPGAGPGQWRSGPWMQGPWPPAQPPRGQWPPAPPPQGQPPHSWPPGQPRQPTPSGPPAQPGYPPYPADGQGHEGWAPQVTRRDLPPAGWYPDPAGGSDQRWWDGVGWTQHTR